MKTFLRKSGIFAIVFVMANLFFSNAAFGQTVTSDKDDYAPGEVAIITGEGWTGDDFVDIHFEETPFVDHIHDYHDIPIMPDGTFRIEFAILDRHLGVAFVAKVKGQQTGRVAITEFTDANITVAATGLPAGASLQVSYRIGTGGLVPTGSYINTASFTPPPASYNFQSK